MERLESHACFGGQQEVWRHESQATGTPMTFGVFLPPQAAKGPLPVIYWLSGLTCTEQNFITKAAAQRYATEHGVILVNPDTSPRGDDVADDSGYDLGKGAGFYLNATQQPWAANYRMADYIAEELPALVEGAFPVSDRRSIMGHSMGGHGALVTAFRNPGRYRSVSAFSPIVGPSDVPWGEKALTAYLGPDRGAWAEWDAVRLIPGLKERLPLLIDQGGADEFLVRELQPERLVEACKAAGHPVELRLQDGYDHSYYFISTFMGDHIAWHAKALKG
ncbi:S-formylglutathione hydrolase [Haematobacter genomosp. 1]|uniref:S-formylglutathione hydrolase n=1 Tax=Haematobacter genomosp. 1 TaxID=366618 RepID=A0A212A9K7_9RHOB|nr:S-formylglutathione hydrolase [Haematobacter genomosp. 1]OWJ76801.1 S-formylglutathione hydrolase [Haematobacter genomosp. 1]